MQHFYSLENESIILSPIGYENLEELRNWRNDPLNNEFLLKRGEISRKQQEAWYEGYLSDPSIVIFGVTQKINGRSFIGSVSLYDLDLKKNSATFGGIMIGDRTFRGRGLGQQITVICVRIAFELMNLVTLNATVNTKNIPAICVYSKVGFTFRGVQKVEDGTNSEEFILVLNRRRFERLHSQSE